MIIDPIDLKIIRQLELHGSISIHDIIGKFQITEDEILLRIKNLEDAGFIKGYGLKLFVPGIAGGRWYWGCIASESTAQFRPTRSVALLEEIVENLTFPAGVCPNLSLLFYTQNLQETYKIINKTPGIKYAEVYKIDDYNIRVKKVLLKEDWQLIAQLYGETSKLNYPKINSIINNPKADDEIKLSRLIWSSKNRQGVITVFPSFDWSVIKNYLHLHIAVATERRIKELRRIVNKMGFSGNITSRFKKRFIQLEFDIWGFSDMQTIFSSLKAVKKLTVEGYSFAYKNQIYNEWLEDYINSKI